MPYVIHTIRHNDKKHAGDNKIWSPQRATDDETVKALVFAHDSGLIAPITSFCISKDSITHMRYAFSDTDVKTAVTAYRRHVYRQSMARRLASYSNTKFNLLTIQHDRAIRAIEGDGWHDIVLCPDVESNRPMIYRKMNQYKR